MAGKHKKKSVRETAGEPPAGEETHQGEGTFSGDESRPAEETVPGKASRRHQGTVPGKESRPVERAVPEEGPMPDEIELPVEDFIDLHPFRPREIPSVVESYLEAAAEAGFFEVRLIHGRGIGVQRERVRSVLSRHPLVESFSDAPSPRGGWGATVVRLRRPQGG
jgi:DNA-nicking Smr family endonuclease